jgi:hypothetical protein
MTTATAPKTTEFQTVLKKLIWLLLKADRMEEAAKKPAPESQKVFQLRYASWVLPFAHRW